MNDNPSFVPVNDGEYPLMPPDKQHDPGLTLGKATKRAILWMSARRFVKGAICGGGAVFATTRDLPLTVIGAILGGLGQATEKLMKENNKANGSTLTLANVWKEVSEAIIAIYKFLKQKKTSRK